MGFISTESWSLESILARSKNFHKVSRVSVASQSALLAAVDHHEETGIPLIVEGLHMLETWNSDLFNVDTFCELIGPNKGRRLSALQGILILKLYHAEVSARNVHSWIDMVLPLSQLVIQLRSMPYVTAPGGMCLFLI
jgi:hypothetical protein